uniref:Uncharacterized protein n=1 Tax=Anguilla anguilla TaxID=7936 RepID=A0A0E9T9M6_ANGAN
MTREREHQITLSLTEVILKNFTNHLDFLLFF